MQEPLKLIFLCGCPRVSLSGEDRFAWESPEATMEFHELLRGDNFFILNRSHNFE
jgi:hypothetical protein